MKVLITGAEGFLGRHLRVRMSALSHHEVIPVGRDHWSQLAELTTDADVVIHLAGVNRGEDSAVEQGNIELAEDLAAALPRSGTLRRVVYADSVQAGNDTPYGSGKATAADILAAAADAHGASFVDVLLPNLAGEGGRPHYNSFVATFVHRILENQAMEVNDREIELLPAQDAAAVLLGAVDRRGDDPRETLRPNGIPTSVAAVHARLAEMARLYATGDIPELQGALDVTLFNTLRFALFPGHYPIRLSKHADHRGALVETVRAHGGQGQTFVSTTHPGVTRGDHFHLRKVERFVVIAGKARIALRPVLGDRVVDFIVDGDTPVIIDMPTLWAHNITNLGDSTLLTMFWTNELFDPEDPDTYREPVAQTSSQVVVDPTALPIAPGPVVTA